MTASETENWSTSDRVLNAVIELRAANSTATRETVAALTGLKQTVVDDRLRALADDGRLKRVLRGIYEVAEQYPAPRSMWSGIIDGGFVKVEIGDWSDNLTPEECRRLARMLAGYAEDVRVIETVQAHLMLATSLAAQVKVLELKVKALAATRDQRQLDLMGGD